MGGLEFDEKRIGWKYLLFVIRLGLLSSLIKLHPRKLAPWFVQWSFFLLKFRFLSINLTYGFTWTTVVLLYGCLVSADAPKRSLVMLDKVQKPVCTTVSHILADSLEPLAHCQNAPTRSLFHRCPGYLFGRYLSELAELVPITNCPEKRGTFVILIN